MRFLQFLTRMLTFPDIDECSSDPCKHGGNCTNLINQYNCTCVEGYTGLDCETGWFHVLNVLIRTIH